MPESPFIDSTGATTVQTARAAREFDALEADWDRLADESSGATPFQSFAWSRIWWDVYGEEGDALQVMTARGPDGIAALAPLYVRTWPEGWKSARLLGSPHGDYNGFLLPEDGAPSFINAALDRLAESGTDYLEAYDLPPECRTLLELERAAKERGLKIDVWPSAPCPRIDLRGGWEKYLAGLSANMRGQINNKINRCLRAGAVFRGIEAEEEIHGHLRDFARLNRRWWALKGSPGGFAEERDFQFFERMCAAFCGRGFLRLTVLEFEDRPASFMLNFRKGDTAYYYRSAHDPELSRFSPGFAHLALTVKEAADGGASCYDLMRGDEEYKRRWRPENPCNRSVVLHLSA